MKASAGDCDTCHRPAVTLFADHGHEVRDAKGQAFRVAQLCRKCLDEARRRRLKGQQHAAASGPDPRQLTLGLALALEPARGRR